MCYKICVIKKSSNEDFFSLYYSTSFFEMLVFHFIDQKRQDDRCREIQHQHPEIQDNRIFQDVPEIRIHDKLFEILDSYKFAARKSKKCIVIKECDAQPGHSTIFENNEVQKR